jgi:hypothetical protein
MSHRAVEGESNPQNGHAYPAVGYDGEGVTNSTWGMLGTMTWAAIAKYASHENHGELYTVLSMDWIIAATSKAPNRFDAAQLIYDVKLFHTEF